MTTSWTMVWGYGFGSLGELLTSGLGLAFVARYVPARMGGFMMGAYFVASGVAQYLGGIVASFASVPDKIGAFLQSTAVTVTPAIHKEIPGILTMQLGDFRDWMSGANGAAKIADQFQVPLYSALPQSTQQLVQQFNEQLNVVTMPYYTNLFFWLGVAGVVCTVIALAVLPIMRKLDAQHAAHARLVAAAEGVPTIRSEQ
jgi:dipeptide/tripeptide permease